MTAKLADTMKYTQVTIDAPAAWEETLSALCFLHGALGVETEDPGLIAARLAAGVWEASVFDQAPPPQTGRVTLRAQFDAAADLHGLAAACAALAADQGIRLDYTAAPLAERDWLAEWRANFPSLRLGARLCVEPYWRAKSAADLPPGALQILVSPGLAFGTGDHATTALAARLLEARLKPGARVLDLGTGSGILAVAACKLGAVAVLATDIDVLCETSVAEHARLNGVTIPLRIGDVRTDAATRAACRAFAADLVVSNIISGVLVELAPVVGAFLRPGGEWLLSGVLAAREPVVREALCANRWRVMETLAEGEWLAYRCEREE